MNLADSSTAIELLAYVETGSPDMGRACFYISTELHSGSINTLPKQVIFTQN